MRVSDAVPVTYLISTSAPAEALAVTVVKGLLCGTLSMYLLSVESNVGGSVTPVKVRLVSLVSSEASERHTSDPYSVCPRLRS